VQTQADALDATVKDSTAPNWDARLRAAEAIQDLGVPKADHGNKADRGGQVVVLVQPWVEQLTKRPKPVTMVGSAT
jgi:hypothetical protein